MVTVLRKVNHVPNRLNQSAEWKLHIVRKNDRGVAASQPSTQVRPISKTLEYDDLVSRCGFGFMLLCN